MEDHAIVELYWQRNEQAIRETQHKYGSRLIALAQRVLCNREDSEESANDTYLAAWRSIPPHKPGVLLSYLSRLTRQIAIDRYRKKHAARRIDSEYCLSLTELADCVSGTEQPADQAELRALSAAIERWLKTQSPAHRTLFLRRYYWLDSIETLAEAQGDSREKVKSCLFRLRTKLKQYLQKEGFSL